MYFTERLKHLKGLELKRLLKAYSKEQITSSMFIAIN